MAWRLLPWPEEMLDQVDHQRQQSAGVSCFRTLSFVHARGPRLLSKRSHGLCQCCMSDALSEALCMACLLPYMPADILVPDASE